MINERHQTRAGTEHADVDRHAAQPTRELRRHRVTVMLPLLYQGMSGSYGNWPAAIAPLRAGARASRA
jgi:hypothetical protein